MSRISDLRKRIKDLRDALETTPPGEMVVVSTSVSTAGASQSVTTSRDQAKGMLKEMRAELSRLLAGGRFVRGRIVHDFGG